MGYLIEDLLTSVKNRSFAPISQATFSDASLIELVNDEFLLGLVADIMQSREDFFLTTKDTPLSSNVQHYGIPERAIGNALKAIFIKDQSGNLSAPLGRLDIDQSDPFANTSGQPTHFYFEGDEVVLMPRPSSSPLYLCQAFYMRPNRLVPTSECARITEITDDGTSVTFTVDTDLTENLEVNDKIDILSNQSPFLLWARDVEIEAITSTNFQVPKSSIVNLAGTVEPKVGDYICAKGTSNIPMIPIEFHMILAQMTANSMLHALGHMDKLQAAEARLNKMRMAAGLLIKNRAESSPEFLIQRNNLARIFSR